MQVPMIGGRQPRIILLKDGTDESQGIAQVISNINACQAVGDSIRSTLGPRGMDKMIQTLGKTTISNDGATILKLLQVVHPAAQTLVDISTSQDAESGDGTTTVTLYACELLAKAKQYLEEGVHPQIIIKNYRTACQLCLDYIREISYSLDDESNRRSLLLKVAQTAMTSKLIATHRDMFSEMVVDAVLALDPRDLRRDLVGIKKVTGGSLTDSFLVQGVAFKKAFSYAGFEQQPKRIPSPRIAVLRVELELKNENTKAEVRINDVKKYQSIVDAEWRIIFNKLDKIVETGANIVVSQLAIGDLATQYFADRGIFCAGRVPEDDLNRLAAATGAQVQTTVTHITAEVLGHCEVFEERQVGAERYNLFTGCPNARTATLVLRGGSEHFIDETERSLEDAIMVVRRSIRQTSIVPGAGSIEMYLSTRLLDHALTIHGKGQLLIGAFAEALQVIPRQLSENAGFDSTDILDRLRQQHNLGEKYTGVDIQNEGVCNAFESHIWEPTQMKVSALTAATEAACLIMSIDETVKNPQSEQADTQQRQQMAGMMRGRGGMMRGRGGRGRGRRG
eukprot:gnl/Trimastix_PCT/1521.p1 GENE.gnl/Trimastix_PCT/1521~~gnl/Trimastix_PCT/1521.p1  ORF type:complete len:585 (-),score=197.02 gnl/Trimastix_PCT/1521:27-1721(-)